MSEIVKEPETVEKKGNKKKRFSIENIKKADVKHLAKIFTLIWGLVLIVLMTITNIGINKEFNWLTWLSNSLIIFGIMVFGLFMGESTGTDKQMQKPDGLYQTSLKEYETYNESISEELIYFNQFYSWLLPQEIEQKKLDYLIANGVDPKKAEKIVQYCVKGDLEALKSHIFVVLDEKGNEITTIRRLEEHEIEPVEDVLSGYIKLKASNPSYFLTAFADSKINHRITEEGKALQEERRKNKKANRLIKIGTSLGISLIWGLLTVYDFISGNDTQAWVNLVSRITALFTSFLSGWYSSIKDVKLQAMILKNKYKVLQLFHNYLAKKIFIPKTEEQLAEEELREYRAKKERDVQMFEISEENTSTQIDQQQEEQQETEPISNVGNSLVLVE